MAVVDCHTHVFPPEVKRRRETYCMLDEYFGDLYENPGAKIATAEDLLAEMDASGVEVSVLCGFGWSSHDLCVMHNDYLLDCLRRYPGRFLALASLQPLDGALAGLEIERCQAGGMRGVGELMPDGQGYTLDDFRRLGTFYGLADEIGLPIMTHTSEPVGHDYPGKQSVTPDTVWALVQAYPRLRLILAHWGGGYPFYELMPEVRAASRNVYYDSAASTYLYDPAVFVHVTRMVGHEKVLWGSDFPVLRQGRFLGRVRELPLGAEEIAAILGGNAERVFGTSS